MQQINPDSLRQQLAIAQQLAGQLGSSEPVAVPRQPVISSETRTALSEAAGAVLCSQLGLQREVSHRHSRWCGKGSADFLFLIARERQRLSLTLSLPALTITGENELLRSSAFCCETRRHPGCDC